MRQFRIREVVFQGDKEYPQGYGMTYDDLDVVVDLADGEEIFYIRKGWVRGLGIDAEIPSIDVWIKTPLGGRQRT